jgi:acyl-CoA-dependent ceramide synthase
MTIDGTDYPHWGMIPELKRYYLMQLSYWCQQLLVLVLKLERPRKDYSELVVHHLVTLWLVGSVESRCSQPSHTHVGTDGVIS